jgi:replicative DNA helicase
MRNDSPDLRYAASLIGRPAHTVAACSVPPEAIGDARAAALYTAVVVCCSRTSEPAAEDVIAELEERGSLATVGGAEEVHILAALHGSEDPETTRRALLREAERRTAQEAGSALLAAARQGTLGDAVSGLQSALQAVQRFGLAQRAAPMLHVAEHLEQLVELLAAYASGAKRVPRLADLGPLTQALGNPQPGAMVVIGGFSHAGKSFLMQFLEGAYHAIGIGTLRLSLEDPDAVNRSRLASEFGGVSFSLANPTQYEAQEMLRYLGRHLNGNLDRSTPRLVHAPESRDIHAILRDIRRGAQEYGAKVVFVDYAQIVDVPQAPDSRHAVAATVGALKAEAMRLGVTLVLGSQLRKPPSATGHYEPTPHDLKDASELHHAAEVLILCWRERHENRTYRLARVAKDKLTGSDAFAWMVDGPGGVVTRIASVARGMDGAPEEQGEPAPAVNRNDFRDDHDHPWDEEAAQ